MTNSEPESGETEIEKVVIHLEQGVTKGFLHLPAGDLYGAVLRGAAAGVPASLRIRPLGLDTTQDIPIQSAKAIFFVNDFEGDPRRKNLRFYRGASIAHGVWIRVEFNDGEVMEGLVDNNVRFLLEPCFLMRPTDPYSNNRLVYVVKTWIKDCRILGLRMSLPQRDAAVGEFDQL